MEVETQWGTGRAGVGAQLIRNGVDVTPKPPTVAELYAEYLVWHDAMRGSVQRFIEDDEAHLDTALQAMQIASEKNNEAIERLVNAKYTEAT